MTGAPRDHEFDARPVAPRFHRDPHFWIALALGPLAWWVLGATNAFRPVWPPSLPAGGLAALALACIAYPVVEELLFRGTIQPALARRWPLRALPGISAANFHTSLLFALAHLFFHPPALALATYFPSLVFGHLRDRSGSVVPGTIVHAVYNLGFFVLLTPRG